MGKRGSIELILTREFFNSLVGVLTAFSVGDESNKYSIYAQRLLKKIMRYSRRISDQKSHCAVTHFYEDEAAVLIKLLTMYAYVVGMTGDDAFEKIGKERSENEV